MDRELPPIPVTSKSVLRNPLSLLRRKSTKRANPNKKSTGEATRHISVRKGKQDATEQPPTIEELQKIAEDIRKGVY